jgi:hypothetical protein
MERYTKKEVNNQKGGRGKDTKAKIVNGPAKGKTSGNSTKGGKIKM